MNPLPRILFVNQHNWRSIKKRESVKELYEIYQYETINILNLSKGKINKHRSSIPIR